MEILNMGINGLVWFIVTVGPVLAAVAVVALWLGICWKSFDDGVWPVTCVFGLLPWAVIVVQGWDSAEVLFQDQDSFVLVINSASLIVVVGELVAIIGGMGWLGYKLGRAGMKRHLPQLKSTRVTWLKRS